MSPEQLVLLGYAFPNLTPANSRASSPPDPAYNCVAWARGIDTEWWWPDPELQGFWPAGIPRIIDIPTFRLMFDSWGYTDTSADSVEPGVAKVAFFADARGTPTHVARQLPDGWWASKLGTDIDIEHALTALEGPVYGTVAVIMARPVPSNSTV